MVFRLRKEARPFFSEIRPSYDTDFQSYYFCLLVGLSTKRKAPSAPTSNTIELVDYFPKDFLPTSRLIVAVFLRKELELAGVSMDERKSVYSIVNRLINSRAPSSLSEHGFAEMNKFAYEGFDVLSEILDDKPRSLETFLILFKRSIGQLCGGAS